MSAYKYISRTDQFDMFIFLIFSPCLFSQYLAPFRASSEFVRDISRSYHQQDGFRGNFHSCVKRRKLFCSFFHQQNHPYRPRDYNDIWKFACLTQSQQQKIFCFGRIKKWLLTSKAFRTSLPITTINNKGSGRQWYFLSLIIIFEEQVHANVTFPLLPVFFSN